MPYSTIHDLPEPVRHVLPEHAQEIFKAAFNSAYSEYGSESTAMREAWAAVKKKYMKNTEGHWVIHTQPKK